MNRNRNIRKTIGKIVLYLLLSLPFIWLVGGLVIYLQGNLPITDWKIIFLLRDYPLGSLILLVVLGFLYWLTSKRLWRNLFGWLKGFSSLSKITRATIVLSVTFYLSLLVTALLFPRFTGYTFQSDWSLVVVATIPIIALVVLFLIEQATSVKAKFAGVEVEFQRTLTTPLSQTITLEEDRVAKGYTRELRRIIEDIRERSETPHILLVRIVSRRLNMRIDFLALRDYVYELSKNTPLEYIVFIGDLDEYLGFMTVADFKMKYPKFGIEILLEDAEKFEREDVGFRWWERIIRIPFPEVGEVMDRIKRDLVLPQWDSQRDRREVSERDLTRLGAKSLHLKNPSAFEAYQSMMRHNVPGIPVVDDNRRFKGMATKEKVVEEVIAQLIEKGNTTNN